MVKNNGQTLPHFVSLDKLVVFFQGITDGLVASTFRGGLHLRQRSHKMDATSEGEAHQPITVNLQKHY